MSVEEKLVSYGPFKVAIVTNIRMCLKFKVARTLQLKFELTHAYIFVTMATLNGP